MDRNRKSYLTVLCTVRALFLGALLVVRSFALADAKSECEKALAEAKRAGLPISHPDLNQPKPTKDSKKIEEILARADKEMRRNQEELGPAIARDIENVQRKQKGKPEIPYPTESAAQKTKRETRVLKVLDDLVKTKGPRVLVKSSDTGDTFVHGASARGFVKLEFEAAEAAAKGGKISEAVTRFRVARRLVELTSVDETMISVLMQNASVQVYYASLQRAAKSYPAIKKAITREMMASFARPSNQRILQAEFIHSLDLLMKKGWTLPTDIQSLDYITHNAKSWTIAFAAMKNTKTGLEMETAYKSVESKMGSFKMKGDEDEVPYGPAWAGSARALDKAEAKRLETLKVLGM